MEWMEYKVLRLDYFDGKPIPDLLLAAPSQDSPDNILNKLPDDCLRTIFEASTLNIMDLVDIANVCCRFNVIATEIFKTKYKSTIDDGSLYKVPLWRREQLFRTFGASITSISEEMAEAECGMVAKYCSRIKELRCSVNCLQTFVELRTVFTRLDKLSITIEVEEFCVDPHLSGLLSSDMQLKRLEIINVLGRCEITLPNRNLPHLVELRLKGNLNVNMIELFGQANPQIQVLGLNRVAVYMDINVLIDSLPNITTLCVGAVDIARHSPNYICNHQHALLRTIEIDEIRNINLLGPLEAIIQHELPVENLKITCDEHECGDDELDAICQLTTIKCMEIKDLCLDDNQMIRLARELPNLTSLIIHKYSDSLVLSDIRKFMENAGEQLTRVHIKRFVKDTAQECVLDEMELERMAVIARNREIDLRMSLVDHCHEDDIYRVSTYVCALCRSYRTLSNDIFINLI